MEVRNMEFIFRQPRRSFTSYEKRLIEECTTGDIILYCGKSCALSHFYQFTVVHNKCAYSSVEHAYQLFKAFFHKDTATQRAIQSTTDPVEQKRLGGNIHNPPLAPQWNRIKALIIFALDKSKSEQLPQLLDFLRSTGERPIIEFVRCDYWGIGRKGFGGLNTAGNILSMVRSSNFPPYILLGDSTVDNVKFDECGVYSMFNAMLEDIGSVAAFIANLPIRALILCGGTHNITHENGRYNMTFRPPQMFDLMKKIIIEIRNHAPNLKIMVCTILPRPRSCCKINRKIDRYNEILTKFQVENVRVLPMHTNFILSDGSLRNDPFNSEDETRLSISGSAVFSDSMKQCLEL